MCLGELFVIVMCSIMLNAENMAWIIMLYG